jgi:streptogramin lyase
MHRSSRIALLVGACGLCVSTIATGQTAPLQSVDVPWPLDSGPVQAQQAREVVYSTTVTVPNAPWLRLQFPRTELGGVIEEGSGAFLRITSRFDGAVQYLDAVSLEQWSGTSAYFNGDTVTVEVVGFPGSTSRLRLTGITAGVGDPMGADSLCGADDRVLSSDARAARHMPEGCTSWLFNDTNRMFMTAGHCGVSAGDVQQFNVPLSTNTGSTVAPPPEHQYPVDGTSIRSNGGLGIGNDYCYFGTFVNSNTGLTPFQRQGAHHTLATTVPAVAAQPIRITGYGTTSSPVPPAWNQVQKTHSGPRVNPTTGAAGTTVSYQTDTTGGNSGSPVLDESSSLAIGIHTHAGCSTTSGNNGTMITHTGITNFISGPLGVCRTGRGTPTGSLYAVGDAVNNFGTLDTASGQFARVGDGPARCEGMAYNPVAGVFYITTNDTFANVRKLYTKPASGEAATFVANISGTTAVINGLAFDPASGTLYGIAQATGQLFSIDPATAAASAIGAVAGGGTVGALEFDADTGTLYGIDDVAGGSRLITINPSTGVQAVVGALGAGIADCNGLAVTDAGELYTINAATDQLLRINPQTGAATVVGATNGLFAASFGMSAVTTFVGGECYANCDGSTAEPVLNVADFTCFLQRYAAGESYANCDASSSVPILNVADFVCFLQRFADGCP